MNVTLRSAGARCEIGGVVADERVDIGVVGGRIHGDLRRFAVTAAALAHVPQARASDASSGATSLAARFIVDCLC